MIKVLIKGGIGGGFSIIPSIMIAPGSRMMTHFQGKFRLSIILRWFPVKAQGPKIHSGRCNLLLTWLRVLQWSLRNRGWPMLGIPLMQQTIVKDKRGINHAQYSHRNLMPFSHKKVIVNLSYISKGRQNSQSLILLRGGQVSMAAVRIRDLKTHMHTTTQKPGTLWKTVTIFQSIKDMLIKAFLIPGLTLLLYFKTDTETHQSQKILTHLQTLENS